MQVAEAVSRTAEEANLRHRLFVLAPRCWKRGRLIKTGARLVRHGRYAIFQMAEAALPRHVFAGILALINGLRGPPSTAVSA